MTPAFIDPPSPFAPLPEWETFAEEMRVLAKTDPDGLAELERAERHIDELKALESPSSK